MLSVLGLKTSFGRWQRASWLMYSPAWLKQDVFGLTNGSARSFQFGGSVCRSCIALFSNSFSVPLTRDKNRWKLLKFVANATINHHFKGHQRHDNSTWSLIHQSATWHLPPVRRRTHQRWCPFCEPCKLRCKKRCEFCIFPFETCIFPEVYQVHPSSTPAWLLRAAAALAAPASARLLQAALTAWIRWMSQLTKEPSKWMKVDWFPWNFFSFVTVSTVLGKGNRIRDAGSGKGGGYLVWHLGEVPSTKPNTSWIRWSYVI